ncbi:MAG: hypothetical protein L0Y71_02955 [Gemmataceae bacterium]|nr:hypothetical protein [Gemmataceae bacterium]
MVQGYYNLNEAAKVLNMPPDELRQMAQKNQIRSFQDRGTLRFRQADIQELARRRGATSDPDLPLAEPRSGPRTPAPKSAPPKSTPPKSTPPAPKSGPKTPPKTPKQPTVDAPEVFDFALDADDKLDIGREVLSSGGSRSGAKSSGTKPSAGSDSDVKLVAGSGPDSDVKLVGDSNPKLVEGGPRTPRGQQKPGQAPVSPTPKRPSRLGPPAADSGVRLVTTDSDSDVKIVGAGSGHDEVPLGQQPPPSAADSDIRLEEVVRKPPSDDAMNLTEEINLDEELKKQEAVQQQRPKSRVKPKSQLKFPTQSPFELSESDLNAPTEHGAKRPSSSDFELTPAGVSKDDSGSSEILDSGSDDFSLELPDDSAVLGGSGEGELTGQSSGISLSNPVDTGIPLEEGSDTEQLDLDMSLEVESTPKPAKRDEDSDSVSDSSSEFELSLDSDADKDSSSEFELTLDDSGEGAVKSPQAKAGAPAEKDIFETDFEVPALEEDSGSEVAALETSDTDLESSDFDLALDDSDLAIEDESGSQVVALDEESADEAAETIAGDVEDLDVQVDEEDEEGVAVGPVREVVREKVIEPAPWGALPTVFMLPCVIVMVVVGIMGFELVQSSAGFKSAGFFTRALGELVGQKIR